MIAAPRRWVLRLLVISFVTVVALTAAAPAASAHPLGNFTVNTYNGLRVEPDAVAVRMIVDFAEIPTVRKLPAADEAGGVSQAQATEFAAAECAQLAPGARLSVGGAVRALSVESSDLAFVPGAAGLKTMRLTCELRTEAGVETAGRRIEYVDGNSLDRLGWREITAVGDGVVLTDSDVPTKSVSAELTAYPPDLLSSPLDARSASARAVPGSGQVLGGGTAATGGGTAQVGGLTATFTDLVTSRDLGVGFAVVAMAISVGLGVLHAFAPGHGKTLMAAYMLGRQRSSLRQVAVIGLTVTLTHTTGVLVLGVVLSAFALTAPEQIYAWLGLASGVLLIAIGIGLLRQASRRSAPLVQRVRDSALAAAGGGAPGPEVAAHVHGDAATPAPRETTSSHDHDHDHDHHDHDHPPGLTHSHGLGGSHTHPPPSAATGARGLVAVGFVGGLVPAPSALIVLLGGIALGRAWFAVLLVIGYGIGMALALTGTGVALAYAREHLEKLAERRDSGRWRWALRASKSLPAATAVLVIVVGAGLLVRAVAMITL
ncbi:MAG: High-affinity nickel-transporter [Nocardioidaceae bacterium]|nr:High-affinity nickel-transporter [Nocardioidaceae bacterium]